VITALRIERTFGWDEEAVRSHEDGWSRGFENLKRTLEEPG
jgi:hypothetical protein